MMKLEIIPQDEAWVKQAKKNLTALYENRPLERMPFEFVPHDIRNEFKPKSSSPSRSSAARSLDDVRRDFFDAPLQLKNQLEAIGKRVRRGFWDDTILALHPIASTVGWLPEVFGCEIEWFTNRPPYPHPRITRAADIDHLRPRLKESPLYQAALQQMRFFRQTVGGQIPVAAPDLQCPLSVASMIFDYNQLVYAMMDEPRRVHALLGMITETMIEAVHAIQKELEGYPLCHFDWWFPKGICVSDDLQAVFNPELYREFAVPYNEKLAAEFGGLATYSSGLSLHNMENVAVTKGLFAAHVTDPLVQLAPVVRDRAVMIVGGVAEVVSPCHPGTRRLQMKTPEALEDFWWKDCGRLPEIEGQRALYLCHALLCNHTPQEVYERMLEISKQAAVACPA